MQGARGPPYVGLQLVHLVLHRDAQLRGGDGQQLQLRERGLHLDDLRKQQQACARAGPRHEPAVAVPATPDLRWKRTRGTDKASMR